MDSTAFWVWVDAFRRLLQVPLCLFIALMFPKIFYSSFLARILTLAFIAFEAALVFRPHEITNMIILYLTGFGAILFLIWSAIMLLFCNPLQDFRRLRRVAVTRIDAKPAVKYEWEAYPTELGWERASWVLDLLVNLRGVGWNYQKPRYLVPQDVQKLYQDIGIDVSSFKPTRGNTLDISTFYKTQSMLLVTRYLLVDLCINLMDINPFFQGSEPPLNWIFPLSPRNLLLAPYNAFLAAIGVYAVLDLYGTCVALIQASLLGPNILGTWGEPFMYPRLWGPLSAIWDEGIIGFWSTMWHDVFKHAFLTLSRALIPGSTRTSKFLRLNTIFVLSALCHAAASYMQAAHTYPILTSISFASQGLAISLQSLIVSFLEKRGVSEVTRKTIVLVFAVVWAYFSMYMFLGDLAASRAFTLKLVPVSVFGLVMGRRWPGWLGS
ncbi:uncharacterized protein LY89DRAFT_732780 [Mollisia scopiformis]|uniref:Wax synthase domain-containing protein n=1 Tax=Mollisia scopiformis TaxID=149040 RepID=A0A194XE99_MOLSC|nr:uncharacterized protein LY89DRAFT_732780 [Mollisia scopiformis]KUJ18087.1 hypothetical protein LY89DRAFT_732780 [Mollisia scopiformis]